MPAFLAADTRGWLDALSIHAESVTGEGVSSSQRKAWADARAVLADALRGSRASRWNIVFEYELPFEGGRRPDAILHAGATVVVLEFKSSPIVDAAQLDQVAAYARELREYHEASHGRRVEAVLISTAYHGPVRRADDVHVTGPRGLAGLLTSLAQEGVIDFEAWLRSPYGPLPSLVSAARRIFRDERLPHVRRAIAARVPETVALVDRLAAEAQTSSRRRLIFVTGVPGAGKTLVGLRVVYERSELRATSTFLSGNGPLVKVLQDALGSQVFVRELHKFISSYALSERVPEQQLIVFDEAQRAWDSAYMLQKKRVASSEPELLLGIGARLPAWAALVGLVGEGQSIYSGEEGGMPLWRDALDAVVGDEWEVFCPPSLGEYFGGLNVTVIDDLELRVPIRSRQAERLAAWVDAILSGRLAEAARHAESLRAAHFPVYVTRDLGRAKEYARHRYAGEPDSRFGLLASSHARSLKRHGVDNEWFRQAA